MSRSAEAVSRRRLWIEMAILYGAIPAAVALVAVGRPVLPVLWAAAIGCGIYLRRAGCRSAPLFFPGWKRVLSTVVARWLLGAGLMLAVLGVYRPDQLAVLPRNRPALWLLIVAFYPWISVVPQGVVYRAFFFHRYGALFSGERARWLAAALVFSFSHVVFRNLWAVVWTLPAGWLFARTYRTTGSLGLSNLEHALYGTALFTMGWGAWFFHGTPAAARAMLSPPSP
jgi:hypothetical protein